VPSEPPAPGARTGLSPDAYRRITLLALVSLAVIVVTGAAVRLTGSGLGCSDWPTCERGQLAPADLRNAPAMVEFTNRTITGVVSVAVILAVLGSLARRPRRRDLTRLSLGLVAGVVAQIVLGGLVVLLDLSPRLVMAHFALSMVIVWNAVVLHHRAGLADLDLALGPDPGTVPPAGSPPSVATRQLVRVTRAVVALAGVVVLTGTVVTAAGPHAGDQQASRLDLPIADVARVHGIVVMVLLAVVLVAALLSRAPEIAPGVRDGVSRLLVVLAAQAAVGYTQYFTHVPPLLVGVHICGALAVWISAIELQLRTALPTTVPRDHPSPVAA
jgi:cytochrome c oxidase assembly protein subunit 15